MLLAAIETFPHPRYVKQETVPTVLFLIYILGYRSITLERLPNFNYKKFDFLSVTCFS